MGDTIVALLLAAPCVALAVTRRGRATLRREWHTYLCAQGIHTHCTHTRRLNHV